MAIIAVALAAASRTASLSVGNSEDFKLRVLADMVAQNRLEAHQARKDWLPPGRSEGQESQAGIAFEWREEVSETPNPAFRKVVVEVRRTGEGESVLRALTGFLIHEPGKP